MYSGKPYQPSARTSLSASQKDRYLVDLCSPLYKCVSSTNQKLKSSAISDEYYDWGKLRRGGRYSDISDLAKSTPSLYITTYRETVHLSPDETSYQGNRSLSPVPYSRTISSSGLNYLPDASFKSLPPSPVKNDFKSLSPTPIRKDFKNLLPSPIRRSSPLRRSFPKSISSSNVSTVSSATLPSFSKSSGIYGDLLDDDQLSLHSSTTGSTSAASTRSGSGQGPLRRLAPGSPGRNLIPWYLSDLDVDLYKEHHTASDILQSEIRHGNSNLIVRNCASSKHSSILMKYSLFYWKRKLHFHFRYRCP